MRDNTNFILYNLNFGREYKNRHNICKTMANSAPSEDEQQGWIIRRVPVYLWSEIQEISKYSFIKNQWFLSEAIEESFSFS
jgi:hypothetical protein